MLQIVDERIEIQIQIIKMNNIIKSIKINMKNNRQLNHSDFVFLDMKVKSLYFEFYFERSWEDTNFTSVV